MRNERSRLLRNPQSPFRIFEKEVIQMTQWQCTNCGYTFGAEATPEKCPSCQQVCTFNNVTCYIPDCGGPGNVDPRLMGKQEKPVKE